MANLAAVAGYGQSLRVARTDDSGALGDAIGDAVALAIRDAESDGFTKPSTHNVSLTYAWTDNQRTSERDARLRDPSAGTAG